MPLNAKNKSRLKLNVLIAALALWVAACGGGDEPEKGVPLNDSISKAQQRLHADSLKKKNPLLILPPDSDYTGDYIDKYPSGIVKFRGFYRFGKRHGQWMSFYPNGLAWSEMHYDKGLREGPNLAYFENGKMRYRGFYKNDKQDSIWCYYDSVGDLAVRVLYKNDRMVKKLPLK
jgi:antitoxin component YwqK of YwqJK toxin-antitoxin module